MEIMLAVGRVTTGQPSRTAGARSSAWCQKRSYALGSEPPRFPVMRSIDAEAHSAAG
jgi:hypothetical protein